MINIHYYFNYYLLNENQIKISKLKEPLIIGCFVTDKFGKTILVFESSEGKLENVFKKNIKDDKKKELFNIDYISMFLSAIEMYSEEYMLDINRKYLELNYNDIKIYSIFNFRGYIITFLMNPEISIESIEEEVFDYFSILFKKYQDELEAYSNYYFYSPQLITRLERKGNGWLNAINKNLIKKKKGKNNSNIFRCAIQKFKKL